ncbi:MAG TPA: hypothetical protein VNJ04_02560 [Gemmatimonadaceae bacterium]|nr:hypothetical protein [Gemmatimonadaceae bacterium]
MNLKLTNKQVLAMSNALRNLGNRKMGSVTADLKVGRLIRLLAPHAEPIAETRQKIATDLIGDRDIEEMSVGESNLLASKMSAAQTELDMAECEIDLPASLKLTLADLPKERTGDDGWKNATQLGAITADLGQFYDFPAEPGEGVSE